MRILIHAVLVLAAFAIAANAQPKSTRHSEVVEGKLPTTPAAAPAPAAAVDNYVRKRPDGSVEIGTTVLMPSPTGGDDTTRIQAAIDAATVKGGTVYLSSGDWSVSSLTMKSGVTLRGDKPSLEYVAGIPQDLSMVADKGTWITCSGVCVTGNNLRGFTVESLGFKDWPTKMMSFGGDGLEGPSFSVIRDVYGVGSTTINGSDIGIEAYNYQHFRMDHVKIAYVNTGLRLVTQNNYVEPGNSVITDFYVSTYPKSVANGNNAKAGIEALALAPTTGPAVAALNYTDLIRPQVNSLMSPAGDGTGIGIKLLGIAGTVINKWRLLDTDIEGPLDHAIYADYADGCYISIASSPAAGVDYEFGAHTYNNLIESNDSATAIVDASGHNIYRGFFAANATNMRGVFIPDTTDTLTIGDDFADKVQITGDLQISRAAGTIRVPRDGAYRIRNEADNADWNVMTMDASGIMYFGDGAPYATYFTPGGSVAGAFVKSTTPGETRLMLWDVTAGDIKPVLVGTADSCGTGYKCLRVAN